jgi:hypothetical protein
MLIRTLFFLLLAGNIGFYSWQVVYPRQSAAPAPVTDPGVAKLQLLREREQELQLSTTNNVSPALLGDTNCFSLGPFLTQADLRRGFNTIAPFIEKSQQRQSVQTRDRGYWVYLPAVPTREEALELARELSLTGLKDYYVVTAGDQQNTVSLGLFRESANALRRQTVLKTLGFDAQLARRTEDTLVYWLDYSRLPDAMPPWERVVASNNNVTQRPINCFR